MKIRRNYLSEEEIENLSYYYALRIENRNKSEYYFYSDLPCQATFISSKEKKNNTIQITKKLVKGYKHKTRQQLSDINKNQLSEFGKGIINQSVVLNSQNKLNQL